MITRKKINLSEERRVLSQMITSTPFLTQLKDIAKPKLFKSSYSQTIAQWIWEYFEHTNESPGRNIEDVYLKNKSSLQNEEDTELIAEFLHNLSKDWERSLVNNVKFSFQNALDFFKLRDLELMKTQIEDAIQLKDPKRAENLIANYKMIDTVKGNGIDLFTNANAIRKAFNKEYEFLFKFPKTLGQAVGSFVRGDFFAILGAPKKGKTWWLMFTAIRAVLMGLKVVFISLEMTDNPVIRRLWKGFTGQPDKRGKVELPYFVEDPDNDKFKIQIIEETKKGVDLTNIEEQQKKYSRACRGGQIHTEIFPSGVATIHDINNYLDNLAYYESFVPDVIVVDYADIIKPENIRMDKRHQLDYIWTNLRGMAQQRNCLVVTGTQTNKKGITKDAGASDVAEDMRKLAHITKMMILNQNEKEEEAGIIRVKASTQREEKVYNREVVVLQGLDIGRPYLDSKFINEVDMRPFEINKKKRGK